MNMETVISLLSGVGLSAACGYRVFVPLLFVSLATAELGGAVIVSLPALCRPTHLPMNSGRSRNPKAWDSLLFRPLFMGKPSACVYGPWR